MDYQFINERIMLVRFRGKARNVTAVQCYASTEDAETDRKEAFYDVLNTTLANTPKRDLIILMGDVNTKVEGDNTAIEHVAGKHGVGEMNKNGELLVECCGLNSLKIGGTLFPHKHCHLGVPELMHIDHICISAKWSNILMDARNKRGVDIRSDHHLLIGDLRLTVKLVRRNLSRTPGRSMKFQSLKVMHIRLPSAPHCVRSWR